MKHLLSNMVRLYRKLISPVLVLLFGKACRFTPTCSEYTIEALEKDPKLSKIEGYIDASGEGEWTIEEAKKLDVPVDIIEESFKFRKRSQMDKKVSSTFAARLVAALRNAFGGHEVKKK